MQNGMNAAIPHPRQTAPQTLAGSAVNPTVAATALSVLQGFTDDLSALNGRLGRLADALLGEQPTEDSKAPHGHGSPGLLGAVEGKMGQIQELIRSLEQKTSRLERVA